MLKKMKPTGVVGPDKVPSFLLKDCAIVFSSPLTKLFNLCLKTNTFPVIWKTSKIIPVFKKNDRNNIENYRPVTIISNFSKCLEMALYGALAFQVGGRISPNQHGFIRGRSTTTNLLSITQFIADSIDTKSQVDVVYTDFSKAFDRLDHGILLYHLDRIGFSANLLMLFESYLKNRLLRVEYCGQDSVELCATSGVPQGSILGPLLFNIFINGVTDIIDLSVLLYADDMKIFSRIDSPHDCERLQRCVDRLVAWCSYNNLPLNVEKCKVMSYTLKSETQNYNYSIGDTMIGRVSVFKDLGVTFDSKLSFVQHISEVVQSSFRALGFIVRNTRDFSNSNTLKLLYYAFVRSKLEYASIVWSPFYAAHINALEQVQRRFLKYLSLKTDGVYPQIGCCHSSLLQKHSLDSLEVRRTNSELKLLYKLLHNEIDSPDVLSQINFLVPRSSRYSFTFYVASSRTNVSKYSPLKRMQDAYNLYQCNFDIFSCSLVSVVSSV